MASNLSMTTDRFETEVLGSNLPVLVDFWAEWCGPCKMIGPSIEALASEYDGKAKVFKLNVDEEPAIAEKYGIMGIPALLMFKEGKVVDRMTGAGPKPVLEKFLKNSL
jgi:thioredoxin 1